MKEPAWENNIDDGKYYGKIRRAFSLIGTHEEFFWNDREWICLVWFDRKPQTQNLSDIACRATAPTPMQAVYQAFVRLCLVCPELAHAAKHWQG